MEKIKYAFRIVHIDNIPHILSNGFVHKKSHKADENYVAIGDDSVILTRNDRVIYNDKSIGDFIPFYFGPRSPMLYVIQHGFNGVKQYNAEYIVYCVLKLENILLHNLKCCFTDGHAISNLTTVYDGRCLNKIDELINYKDVYASNWKDENDRDLKRRKEAEILFEDEISAEVISGFIVYNDNAKKKLLDWGVDETRIIVKPNYYFE